MNTTVELKLDAELVETLKRTTAEQGVTLDEVMTDLARRYVSDVRHRIIEAETERYKGMHPELVKQYLGQHVAIHEGKLVDHDTDAMTLVRRVREQYGRIPILFIQVQEQPEQELLIHSTRLVSEHEQTV